MIQRREFITLLGGAAMLPVVARAQQPAMPVIGFLRNTTAADSAYLLTPFRQGLKEAGYAEGENVTVEYRFTDNRYERLPALAAELVRRQVAVIVAGGMEATIAAKNATASVPIVFAVGGDPVSYGLVASLNRPGGNATGAIFFNPSLGSKRFALLHELLPQVATIAVLVDLTGTDDTEVKEVQMAARSLGQRIIILQAGSEADFDAAFESMVQQRAGGLYVCGTALFNSRRSRLVTLAERYSIPATYANREAVAVDGGLMSYGTNGGGAYRQAGIYVGRILKGEKPGDLPAVQPTKFELVINLKTAKALGLTVPPSLLATADEVIE